MATESPLVSTDTADARDAETPVVQAPLDIRNVSLTVLAAIAVTFTLQQAQDFLIPLVLSALVSYALDPIVTWLAAHRLPRAIAAALVLVAITGGAAAGIYGLRDQAGQILDRLPQAAARMRSALAHEGSGVSTISQVQRAANEIERTASQASTPSPAPRGVTRVQIEEPPIKVRDYLWWGSASAAALLGQLVAVLFLVYFQLVSGDLFKRKLVRITGPTLTKKKITVQILDEINLQIERFLLVQVFTSVLVGLASWIAFWYLGLQQAAIWALGAGLFNSIPYFGPVVVTADLINLEMRKPPVCPRS